MATDETTATREGPDPFLEKGSGPLVLERGDDLATLGGCTSTRSPAEQPVSSRR